MRLYLFLSIAFLGLPLTVCAATLELRSRDTVFDIGEPVQVDVVVNPEDLVINTVAGKIVIPRDQLDMADIADGNSVVSLWVEAPHAETENTISFAGIIPGGYGFIPGHLFSFFVIPKKSGHIALTVSEGTVLIHDGAGTPASVSTPPLIFTVTEHHAPSSTLPAFTDTDLPETFAPEVSRDATVFSNQWFLVFSTQDKGSGIDYYAVEEQRENVVDQNAWIKTASPFVLKDQHRRSYIFVKAVDKKGNERIAVVPPAPSLVYTSYLIWSILIISMLVCLWLFLQFRKKRYQSQ